MRRIISRQQIVADDWRYPGDDATAGPVARSILPLVEFVAQFAPGATAVARGVQLSPPDAVETLAPHLQHVELVAIVFTSVGEGRGYTQGRLLRERFRYTGELRATGGAKRDQLYFLARCGFDSFDLPPSEDLDAALAHLHRFSVAYQRTTGDLPHPAGRALNT
ncbi:MAG: DUF934 domain-containing protein [Steroidobacteraceae bacterium]